VSFAVFCGFLEKHLEDLLLEIRLINLRLGLPDFARAVEIAPAQKRTPNRDYGQNEE
jgi:hypothetical protein